MLSQNDVFDLKNDRKALTSVPGLDHKQQAGHAPAFSGQKLD